MKNLRLHTCVTWAVLLKMASVLANRRVFQPFGPLMCKSLTNTCSGLSSVYHGETLTCIIHVEEASSNKLQVFGVNGLTSLTKIEGCGIIQEAVQEKPYPRLFFAENRMNRSTITQLDWSTGRKKQTFLADDRGQITSLTCSHSDKKIYFVLGFSNKHIVGSINSRGNVTHILTIKDGDTIAVDGRKRYIFIGSSTASDTILKGSIFRCNFSGEHTISQRLTVTQRLELLIGIEADPDRELIYIGTKTRIYTTSYTGKIFRIFPLKQRISSIAYDPSSRFLYILRQKDVKRMPHEDTELKQILACDEIPFAFDVHQDVVLLANKNAILTMDLKSNTSVWSKFVTTVPYITAC